MAQDRLVGILKEDGVEVWNQYVSERRAVEPQWVADLSHARLAGAKLKGANLSRANLKKADLTVTDLENADLRSAELLGTNLGSVNLASARMEGASLRSAILSGANLIGADLARTSLQQSLLNGADLCRVNLNSANLSHADLSGTDISDATLRHANLTGANLTGANLDNSDLSSAELVFAILNRSSVSRTLLENAKLGKTVLVRLDLREVSGLRSTRHFGPSSVGVDTLIQSKGTIPGTFLRGCGVSDSFLEFQRSLCSTPIDFYSCFISYSHKDKLFARRLHDGLQGRGIRCWLDEHELLPGDSVQDQIDRGIRLWDKVLVCCSEASLGFSTWVDIEVEKAMQKEAKLQKERGKRVHALIPLNLDNYLFDHWTSGMASVLKGRLAADFTGWETDNAKFEQQFEKVVQALQAGGAGRELPPISKL